ncbi:MAG: BrnA antitoxin family protein [Cyanobacteria bacterium REEB67]|nr:BrnA antitoxin family protein [Cyanobacteria bacterium REEB67]
MNQQTQSNNGAVDDDTHLWETGQLGCSEEHCVAASSEVEAQVDAALGLEPTTLRLQVELVAAFKQIAAGMGIGYKPLMRQALAEFAESRGLPMRDKGDTDATSER